MLTNSPCRTPSWRHHVINALVALPFALLLASTPAWARQTLPTAPKLPAPLHALPRMTEQVSLTILGSNRLAGVQRGPSAVSATLEALCADTRSLPHRFALDADTELWLSSTSAGPVMLRVRYDSVRQLQRLDVVPHDQDAFDRQFASDLGVRRTSLATARNRRTVLALHTDGRHTDGRHIRALGSTVHEAWVVLAAREETASTANRPDDALRLVHYRFDLSGQVTKVQQLRAAPHTQIALLLDNP